MTTAQINNTTATLEKFVFLNIDFSSYSGLAASDQDLTQKLGYEKETISSGEVKTVHRDRIKPFSRLRGQARTAALKYGTSFMGGYAIPITHWDGVKAELENIVSEFDKESQDFISNYEAFVEEWVLQRKPEDGNLIRAHAHSKDWVENRFNASISACFLSPAPDMEKALSNQLKGMYGSICRELAVEARQAIKAYNKGSKITTRILSSFKGMTEKLDALSFLTPQVGAIKKAIDDYLDSLNLPKTGKFEAQEQSRIALILSMMTNEENIPQLADLLNKEQEKIAQLQQKAAQPVTESGPVKADPETETKETKNVVEAEKVEADDDEEDDFFFV